MTKFLISLSLIAYAFSVCATGTGEMSERELSNKFIATIQESKIQDQLTNSTEFKACQSEGKLEQGKDNTDAIKKISECFQKNLSGKSAKQLETLSDKMGLQSYGLVKSKSSKEITDYLSKKIKKALTGVDPDEANLKDIIEKSKFKNQNIVDQSVFLKLYQTQLGKNTLLEISRFCYQDLRNTDITDKNKIPKSFKDYWGGDTSLFKTLIILDPKDPKIEDEIVNLLTSRILKATDQDEEVTPTGTIKYYPYKVETISDEENKDQLDKIAGSFQDIDASFSEGFFTFCSRLIKPLCKVYEKNVSANPTNKMGAKACITQSRLEQYRKALSKTSEFLKKIEEDPQGKAPIFNIAGMKVYDGKGDNSIDAITSISSSDIMQAQSKQYKAKIENFDSSKCEASPELADCEVLIDKDQSNFEIDNVNLKMSVKNAAEIERLKAMKKANDQNLEKYLTENGYADILDELKNKPGMSEDELADLLRNKFNARKQAYLDELKNKVGSQQVADTDDKKQKSEDVIKEIKAQPAQLAQLVMFNNIISSSFELKNIKGDSLGRNTSGIDREMKDAQSTGLETSYFSGIKGTDSGAPKNNNNQNNSITGLQFLDSILGFEETKEELK